MADRPVSYRPGRAAAGPQAGRGRVADRTTVGSAVAGSGAANSLPTGQSAAAVLAKSVWQAGYALKSRGAESLRAGEGIPRTQVTAVPNGTGLPSAKRSRRSRCGEAA